MPIKTVVAIQTLNAIEWVAPLVEHLLLADKVDEIWVYDNGCTDITAAWTQHRRLLDERLFHVDATGMGFYQMWNHAMKKVNVENEGPVNLAFLNSDIRLAKNAVADLARIMRAGDYHIASVDPRRPSMYSQHIMRWNKNAQAVKEFNRLDFEPYASLFKPGHANVIAWAFVMAAEFWRDQPFAVHPGYQWWFGDDDLFRRAEARGGRLCQVMGIGSDHLGASSDAHNPRKQEMIMSDRDLFNKMWLGM